MPRDYRLYLDDMLEAIDRVHRYVGDRTFEDLAQDELRIDGVVRNLELLGEAAKHLPHDLRDRHPAVPWRALTGLRDILAHQYFSLNLPILWDLIHNELPQVSSALKAIAEAAMNSEQSGN